MDLKIKDVAELLSVSETTIRRWLTGGKIPAYRLNHQYRFSRIEIENWMMSCKLDQEKELLPLTGYIKGGCSPIGMKKHYPTFIDETAQLFDKISVSAGIRGIQIMIKPDDLAKILGNNFADLI